MSDNNDKNYRIVNAVCRRRSSILSSPSTMYDYSSNTCTSNRAYVVKETDKSVTLKCVDCGYTWTVNKGGAFNIQ